MNAELEYTRRYRYSALADRMVEAAQIALRERRYPLAIRLALHARMCATARVWRSRGLLNNLWVTS